MKKKIMITFLISLIVFSFSGCIENNNPNNQNNVRISPEMVYIDDDYNDNTSGWGYDHFKTIEDGLRNVSENGTIYINEGLYYENLIVNKTINIIGENKL